MLTLGIMVIHASGKSACDRLTSGRGVGSRNASDATLRVAIVHAGGLVAQPKAGRTLMPRRVGRLPRSVLTFFALLADSLQFKVLSRLSALLILSEG